VVVRRPQQQPQPPQRRVVIVRRSRKPPSFWRRIWGQLDWKYKLATVAFPIIAMLFWLSIPRGETVETFVLGPGEAAPAESNEERPVADVPDRATSGTLSNGAKWRLIQPVIDNYIAFKQHFPGATYSGDIGDPEHQNDNFPQDHTPYSAEVYYGQNMKRGWIYAQDLGAGDGFGLPRFVRWLLDELRKGKYEEVKYVISRHQDNLQHGDKYYGTFIFAPDRTERRQNATFHEKHVHISFRPGYEEKHSTIVADYVKWLDR
jgi:hypothetical protein